MTNVSKYTAFGNVSKEQESTLDRLFAKFNEKEIKELNDDMQEYMRQRKERIQREDPDKEVAGRNREMFLDTTETLGMHPYKGNPGDCS